jgi:general secretion pathway protein K
MHAVIAPFAKSGRADGGFVVVAVLWMLGALAALASIYSVYVTNTAVSLSVNDDRLQAEALITASLELTAYRLSVQDVDARPTNVDAKPTNPTNGAFRFRLGRSDVAVDFRAEAARIDLNMASKELLAGLFAGLGASYDAAESYADRIIGWRKKGEVAGQNNEAAAYRTAGLSYGPRQGPFSDVGELWLVLGLPPALVERALPYVTVFSGRAEIDVLDAAPEVVAALPGMTPDHLYAILSQRGPGEANAKIVQGLLGGTKDASTEGGKAMRVTVRIAFDNGRRVSAETVILPLDDGDEPFRVLSWYDDFDGPG